MKKGLIIILITFLFVLVGCTPTKEEEPEEEKHGVYTIYLTTENNQTIDSKEDYVKGTVEVKDGKYQTEPLEMEIRGRGNSTWDFEKKPYRMRLVERHNLLGLNKVKNYVLLAEYTDKSLLRNYLGHKLSSYLKTYYVLETRFVEVYLNNDYIGVYLLTEHIKDDKEGLVIDDYLLELEQGPERIVNEGIENKNWFNEGVNLVIKEPDMDELTEDEVSSKVSYLKNFIRDMTSSFSNGTYDYFIDLNNFIDYFVIHEIFKTVDIGYSSVYSVIKSDKLYMGPHWDFDISLGNGDYFNSSPQLYRNRYNLWFNEIIDDLYFQEKYLVRLSEVLYEIMPKLIDDLDEAYLVIKDSAERNFVRWPILGTYVWPNPDLMSRTDTYEGQYKYLKDHLEARIAWLKNEITTKGYYDYIPE